jgi:predicted Co/Zn/Cd cation transporter (cation efflux family)
MNDINSTILMGTGGTATTFLLNQYVNPMLATLTGVLTVLILVQKLIKEYKNIKDVAPVALAKPKKIYKRKSTKK